MIAANDRLTLSVKEAARLLGISKQVAYTLAHDGTLPVLRLGKRILVSKVGLEKMLAEAGQQKKDVANHNLKG